MNLRDPDSSLEIETIAIGALRTASISLSLYSNWCKVMMEARPTQTWIDEGHCLLEH
ncbi:MAG: hypothetical protein KBA96_05050 [Rhodocyclaceae bacterium]|nr:hypothetical protein [Rhodocyclaceae bacterium]MBP7080457.1 hypothetical protein [Rhodocyclaceae bacterium]